MEETRHISEDPLGALGGPNLYAYLGSDPMNGTDPTGMYGANGCVYYTQVCAANGGTYECHVAPVFCEAFPHDEDSWPGDQGDLPIESQEAIALAEWSACVRQCLQEKHRDRMPDPDQCSEDNNISPSDNVADHADCMSSCWQNSENPYDPGGPPLPDGELVLWH